MYKVDLLFNDFSQTYTFNQNISDFAINANFAYFVDSFNLLQINLKNSEIITIPLERKNYYISKLDQKLYLQNPENKLQIFNLPLNANSTPALLANAKGFDSSLSMLLYYNDFEIWTYNMTSGSKELITRIGKEIKKSAWLGGDSRIIFAHKDKLKVIYLDSGSKNQIIEILNFEKIEDFIIDTERELFFIGGINKIFGIYKLKV